MICHYHYLFLCSHFSSLGQLEPPQAGLFVLLTSPHHSLNNLMLLIQDISGSSCTFPALSMNNFSKNDKLFSVKVGIQNPTYEPLCTHCFSVPLIRLSLESVHVCAKVQPRLIQGVRSRDGVGEDQDTIASIRY